jgi:hypothetical protein
MMESAMRTVITVKGSAVRPEQLSALLADYLALDRARGVRRLLVTRCGLLALVVVVAGLVIPGLSLLTRWLSVGVLLTPPAWALSTELRLERRLSQRLDRVDHMEEHEAPAATESATDRS